MKNILLIIYLLVSLQIASFAQNTTIYLICEIKSNFAIRDLSIGLFSKHFKETGTYVPSTEDNGRNSTFYSCLTVPVELKIVDSFPLNSMCDTIPFKIDYSIVGIGSDVFFSNYSVQDTLFRSFGEDTLYKKLEIIYSNEKIMEIERQMKEVSD